jgi:hypothetical protein
MSPLELVEIERELLKAKVPKRNIKLILPMVERFSKNGLIHVSKYFNLIIGKKLTDAGKVLETLESILSENEWSKGYFNALQGMSLALKSKDSRYAYLNQITTDDAKKIEDMRKNFLKQVKNSLQKEFDKGFFSAWSDYLKLLKTNIAKTHASEATSLLKY